MSLVHDDNTLLGLVVFACYQIAITVHVMVSLVSIRGETVEPGKIIGTCVYLVQLVSERYALDMDFFERNNNLMIKKSVNIDLE